MTRRRNVQQTRRGAIAVWTAILFIPLLGLMAFAIDRGDTAMARSELQATADSTSLAGANDEKSADPVDWFIKLPAASTLELPRGQAGDEGLLDIAANDLHPELPRYAFTDPTDHVSFLKYNETSESDPSSQMRNSRYTDSELDPFPGVGRFHQPGLYPEVVNLDFVHVSPVYKSDINALNGVKEKNEDNGPDLSGDGNPDGYTTHDPLYNGVSGEGYRRGLIAFIIWQIGIWLCRIDSWILALSTLIKSPRLIVRGTRLYFRRAALRMFG